MGVQKELLDAFGNLNHDWSARAAAEVELVTELANKLVAARSVPEVATAYQDWMLKRMEMLAEDGHRLLSSSQRLMKAGVGRTI